MLCSGSSSSSAPLRAEIILRCEVGVLQSFGSLVLLADGYRVCSGQRERESLTKRKKLNIAEVF